MAYDKDHIDAVKKQGGFDSSFDASVLGLEGEEKRRLAAKLRETAAPAASADGEAPRAAKGPAAKVVVQGGGDLSLWERIALYFQKLFFGMTEETFVKRRDLRRVLERVRRFKPVLYHPHNGRVTGAFAELLYTLAARLAGFKQLVEVCRAYEQLPAGAQGRSFLEFFVGQHLEGLGDIEKKFAYGYVRQNRAQFDDARVEETVERELDRVLSAVEHERRLALNALYGNFLAYERLAEFNFYVVLRKFGERYSSLAAGQPDFSAVTGKEIYAELIKLEDLLFAVDFGVDMAPLFEALVRFRQGTESEGNVVEEQGAWGPDEAQKLVEDAQAFLRGDRLTDIIRAVMQDPYRTPVVRHRQVNVFDEVRKSLLRRLLPRAQSVAHQVDVDELNARIRDLFGAESLAPIEFYNEATNQRLSAMALPVFANCRHLQILKTYCERLFVPLIKPALNVVVVDGDFLDKHLYGPLSEYFYKFEEAFGAVTEFERKVALSSKEGEKVQDLFTRFSGDPPTRKVVTEKIHYLNNLSAKAVREVAELLDRALPALRAIVADMEKKKPDFVLNIRQLGGPRNRAILRAVERATEATQIVHEIVKDFLK